MTPELRQKMGEAAVAAAKHVLMSGQVQLSFARCIGCILLFGDEYPFAGRTSGH